MTTLKIQNAYYTVENMDRAAAFYGTALGLPLKFRDGSNWAQFSVGGGNFSLSSPAESAGGIGGAILVFEVDDLEAAMQRIVECGGKKLSERDMGDHGRSATFQDTEGNIGQLFKRP